MTTTQGFIVAAWDDRTREKSVDARHFTTGRLADGRSFALVAPAAGASLFVPAEEAERAGALLSCDEPEPWQQLSGEALARLSFPTSRSDAAERRLAAAGISVVATDRAKAADALSALGISGPVVIDGEGKPGRRVDVIFENPRLRPSDARVPLRWVAIDIETDRAGAVVAVSIVGGPMAAEVLFLGPALNATDVTSFASEAGLLTAFAERLRARDPDVVTGWNVVDFDLSVLAGRFAHHGLSMDLGRTPGAISSRTRDDGRRVVGIAGRAVIDAMRLVRASGQRFDDLSLDEVARVLLGEGKTVALRGEAKLAELERLRREEPERFCTYCRRDSELVLEILARTGLDALTARRSALTGVSLELAWTSIPAFERIYGAALRQRRILPPPKGVTEVSGAAGGTVLEAEAGLFSNVLVFDFRSLYPSLMRTFGIDPLAHARAERAPREDDIVAPNGARFQRCEAILPAILTRYAREREAALAAGDDTAAFVYKILQNSFYGVLGSPGCRYGRTELAGAITSFGKLFLTAARDWFEARGHHVLYGDTDSVFVQSGLHDDAAADALERLGRRLASEFNAHLVERIRLEYKLDSHLHMRCEKVYRRFFIPRLRSDASPDARGRGKGYAGLRVSGSGESELEIRGMEAVRSDITPLARRFQSELLGRLFRGEEAAALESYCASVARAVVAGECDAELVYRKMLRRPAEAYDSETPAVRAARLLGWTDRRGRVEYVMTRAGAEPLTVRSGAPLDHAHYLEKQLLPIAQSVAEILGTTAEGWLSRQSQLELFARAPAAPRDRSV